MTDIFYFTRESLPPKARLFDGTVQWVTKTGTVVSRHFSLFKEEVKLGWEVGEEHGEGFCEGLEGLGCFNGVKSEGLEREGVPSAGGADGL